MDALYPQILAGHVTAVIASGGLFFLRAVLLNVFGVSWVMAAPVRYLSYAIDTALLTAALMLMTITRQYPFADAWLTAKVALLVLYVVLGSLALKRAPKRSMRIACSTTAIAVFLFVVSIALTHNPLGALSGLR